MSDAGKMAVGGVNPSGPAAVVNPTPESEMDALLLGRTGVSVSDLDTYAPDSLSFMNEVIDRLCQWHIFLFVPAHVLGPYISVRTVK